MIAIVRLSALGTDRLYPTQSIHGTHFCWRLSQLQGHSAAGRIMSMKNSNDTIGNLTRDLPACSAVSRPTAPNKILYAVTLRPVLLQESHIISQHTVPPDVIYVLCSE